MTDIQELGHEGFMWGLSNSENSGGGGGICRGEKQQQPPPPEIQEAAAGKLSKSKRRAKARNARGDGTGNEESSPDHEIHIWTERERRKKMRNMFANLHALLPQLPPKADKSTIVDEAVSRIKTLQQTLQKLQKQKLEKLQSSISTTTFTYDPSSSSSSLFTSHQTQFPATENYTRESFLADQISSSINPNPNAIVLLNSPPVAFQTWTFSNVVLNICGNDGQFNVFCPKNKLGFFTAICYLLEKYKIEVVSAHVSSDCHRSIYMIQTRANTGYDNQMTNAFGADEMFKQVAREIMLWMSNS